MEGVWVAPAVDIVLGYLLGSIPFGLLLTRAFGAGDLREIGSGSIGATNVLRTGRKGLAAATLLADAAKGGIAVLLGEWLAPGFGILAGGAAMIGHCYPVWLRFRGGKGIATALGILLALDWRVALIAAAVWALTAAVTRISSAGSLAATLAAPVAAAIMGNFDLAAAMIGLGAVVVWKHRSNIERLIAGTEPRIGQKPTGRD